MIVVPFVFRLTLGGRGLIAARVAASVARGPILPIVLVLMNEAFPPIRAAVGQDQHGPAGRPSHRRIKTFGWNAISSVIRWS